MFRWLKFRAFTVQFIKKRLNNSNLAGSPYHASIRVFKSARFPFGVRHFNVALRAGN
jgi:hypothetical protein